MILVVITFSYIYIILCHIILNYTARGLLKYINLIANISQTVLHFSNIEFNLAEM